MSFFVPADGSIVVSDCESSEDRALGDDGTVYGAMKCKGGLVILAPIGKMKRNEVLSADSTDI